MHLSRSPQALLIIGLATISPMASYAGSLALAEEEAKVVFEQTFAPRNDAFAGLSFSVGLSSTSSMYDINLATSVGPFSNDLNLPDLGGEGIGPSIGIGYDFSVGDRFVIGAFSDFTASNSTNDYSGSSRMGDYETSTNYNLTQDYAVTMGGRVGIASSADTLLFGVLGYTAARFSGDAGYMITNGQETMSDSSAYEFFNHGITLGLGIETRVAEASFLRLEFRQTNFKRYDLFEVGDYGNPAAAGINGNADHSARTVTVSYVHRF